MTIQIKTTEQYFLVMLFIILYKVVLPFESVDEILKCDHQMKATEQYFPLMLFRLQACSPFLVSQEVALAVQQDWSLWMKS